METVPDLEWKQSQIMACRATGVFGSVATPVSCSRTALSEVPKVFGNRDPRRENGAHEKKRAETEGFVFGPCCKKKKRAETAGFVRG